MKSRVNGTSIKRVSCYRINGKKWNNRWFYLTDSGASAKIGKNRWKLVLFQQRKSDGSGWINTGGQELLFIQGWSLQTGWLQYKGQWYYCSIRGNENGLGKDKEIWYYMDSTGIMKTGEIEVSGHHYYLEESGAMKRRLA